MSLPDLCVGFHVMMASKNGRAHTETFDPFGAELQPVTPIER